MVCPGQPHAPVENRDEGLAVDGVENHLDGLLGRAVLVGGVVAGILGATDVLVDPFRGMFRLDRVAAGSGSMLDVAAIVALVGWTLIEAVIIAGLRVGDRRVETV